MHPHLVDWYRNVHINPDSAVVERRWETANAYVKKLARESICKLLNLFLFSSPLPEHAKWLTEELLTIDKEFPVSGNTEELRLMAAVVMVAAFKNSSYVGDAFALGLASMSFPNRATQPAQPEILSVAHAYLRTEAEKQRPIDFLDSTPNADKMLNAKYKEVEETETGGDAAKNQAARSTYNKAVIKTIQDKHTLLNAQIRRLAEESAMLWWVLGEYSPLLQRRTAELEDFEYALVTAAEASDRTTILPPPLSAAALLTRALSPCKRGIKKNPTLGYYLGKSTGDWLSDYLPRLNYSDCVDFVPFLVGLTKSQELDDATAAVKALPQLCRGLDTTRVMSPQAAANQFYVELTFVKALSSVNNN